MTFRLMKKLVQTEQVAHGRLLGFQLEETEKGTLLLHRINGNLEVDDRHCWYK